METIIALWQSLTPHAQLLLIDSGKIALLLYLTLACVNKIRLWLIPFELENCFKPAPLDKKKSTRPSPWLSTFLAYGISFSLAGVINNEFIMQHPLWAAPQNEWLLKFWGILLFYLLLICLLKQLFLSLGELLKTPVIENFLEKSFGDKENNNMRYQSITLANKLIHFSTFAVYSSIAWLLGFMLMVELFNLQLFSSLISSLFISSGQLFIALLILLISFSFYSQKTDQSATHIKQSNLVLICCVLLGTLIIGGSSIIISSLPWLFLLAALWFFMMKPTSERIPDFVAGIYLKSAYPIANKEAQALHIHHYGIFESEITLTSGQQEKVRNSKLLLIDFDNERPEDNAS